MKCVDAANLKSQPFDIPSGLARILINKGFAAEWQPAAPEKGTAAWGVLSFQFDGRPFIAANCPACKPKSISHAQFAYDGDAPQAMTIRHCGITEFAPAHIVENYLAALKRFKPRPRVEREELQPAVARPAI